jgi:uncharacterized protein (TIGR00288 family)
MAEHESSLAVLVDFENMARPGIKGRGDFDIHLVLNRLADKGRVLVKRAYADWSRYRDARHELQNAGLELIEMPSAREGAKNRADIKMAVDAMELAFSREHLDTFVIVSGDSDFTPLVGKLRELNKRVTGMGNRDSASELLIANCDEFIFYDSLAAAAKRSTGASFDPTEMLRQTLTALQREGTEWPLASVVKDSMRRKNPAFDESDIGYSTFSKFLEAQGEQGIIRLQSDPRSGTYRVELANSVAAAPAPSAGAEAGTEAEATTPRRRRRRRSGAAAPVGESAEVFEFVVDTTAQIDSTELPPLDQPISYEDMILLGPELGDDVPELVEATDRGEADVEAAEAEAEATTPRRRRRRRSGAAAQGDDSAQAPPAEESPVAEAPVEEAAAAADAAPPEEPALDAEGGSRRRRRRTAPAEPTPVEVPERSAQAPEEVIEVVVTAEGAIASADEAAASASSRRVRRGQRSPALLGEQAPVAEAPVEQATPAPKRRTRKAAPKVAAAEQAPAAEAPVEQATPAPKRRTRKAAPKVAAAEQAPAAEAPVEQATPAPKRRTRKAAPKVAAE